MLLTVTERYKTEKLPYDTQTPPPKLEFFELIRVSRKSKNWENTASFRESFTFAGRVSLMRVCIRQFAAFFGRNTRRGNIFPGREFK